MRLTDVLAPDDILLDVEATNRRSLFEKVGELLASRHGLNRTQVANALYARERLGSTALGHGVAVPHARLDDLEHAIAAFIRTSRPISFDAPDGQPVTDMIVLVVPGHATEAHLRLLADIAGLFAVKAFREKLRTCNHAAQVHRLIGMYSQP